MVRCSCRRSLMITALIMNIYYCTNLQADSLYKYETTSAYMLRTYGEIQCYITCTSSAIHVFV
jgi:hypothetical protein